MSISILKIKNAYYHCIISGISKSEAINIDLTKSHFKAMNLLEILIQTKKKDGKLQIKKIYKKFQKYIQKWKKQNRKTEISLK